jgi:ATP-dependent DNA helicase RecG
VIVTCQIVDRESAIEHVTGKVGQKKTIYLHLKRFFRGTRFTFKPFLNSIANKYQVGDVTCVSGKVSLFYFRSLTHFYVVLQVFKWMN